MIKEAYTKYRYLIFPLLGILNSLPFIFNGLYWISWFSFSLLWIFSSYFDASVLSGKSFYICINLFYFAYYFGAYNFFAALYPLTFAGIGYFVSFLILIFAWLFLSLVHSVIMSLGTYFSYKIFNRSGAKIVFSALLFVLSQYLISVGPCGFPWGRYATAQYYNPYFIQTASLLGPYFVDLIIILVNVFIAFSFLERKRMKYIVAFFCIFVANLLFGIFSMSDLPDTKEITNVSIVQGNVLTDEKWYGKSSFRTYMDDTYELKNSDLIVWGETAIPTELNKTYSILGEITNFSQNTDTELIVGAFYEDDAGKVYNGAYYVNRNGLSSDLYLKRKLVPFGEFLPFRNLLDNIKILDTINMLSYDLLPGNAPVITKTQSGDVSCLICFDSVYHYLARESVKNGAELLTIITNDSWYKDSPSVFLHNGQAVWRAVENGRWVVRSANSGISSFINPKGKIVSSIPPLTKGTITEKVSFLNETTLYTNVGDVIILIILFSLVILFFYEKKKGFCKSKSTNL